jgi:splicing factor 3B subunit 3
METEEGFQPVFFDPRPLTNLELLDRLDSLAPITDMKVANLANEEIPQIYAACGRGARSTLRVLRPGLAVTGGRRAGAAEGLLWERLQGSNL